MEQVAEWFLQGADWSHLAQNDSANMDLWRCEFVPAIVNAIQL